MPSSQATQVWRPSRIRNAATTMSTTDATRQKRNDEMDATSLQDLSIRSRQRLGASIAMILILNLASTTTDLAELWRMIRQEGIWEGYLAMSVSNIESAVLPTGASDLFSIALGEAIGGVIGACVVTCVNLIVQTIDRLQQDGANGRGVEVMFHHDDDNDDDGNGDRTRLNNSRGRGRVSIFGRNRAPGSPSVLGRGITAFNGVNTASSSTSNTPTDTEGTSTNPVRNLMNPGAASSIPGTTVPKLPPTTLAIADGDFFIARSASRSLLQWVGLPPTASNLLSALFAVIPSQLVKINYRRKQSLQMEENKIMDALLQEQIQQQRQLNEQKGRLGHGVLWARLLRLSSGEGVATNSDDVRSSNNSNSKGKEAAAVTSERKTNTAIVRDQAAQPQPITTFEVDSVDVVSDIVRWLEYDVLAQELAGYLRWNGMPFDPALDGAILGGVAGLSSLIYSDLLYGFFRLGPKLRQLEVRTRQRRDWVSLYISQTLSFAALFGVYEGAKIPASRWIQGILAGGFDGCLGSQDFDICLQTYIDTNAPGPSFEAQIRALATNLAMVEQRLHDIYADAGSMEQILQQVKMLMDLTDQYAY